MNELNTRADTILRANRCFFSDSLPAFNVAFDADSKVFGTGPFNDCALRKKTLLHLFGGECHFDSCIDLHRRFLINLIFLNSNKHFVIYLFDVISF